MSTLQGEVYEAFRSIDVPEDKAIAAAAALSRRDEEVASVRADVLLLKWMVGFGLALNVAILLKLFVH